MQAYQSDKPLIFSHIPKTAGSSVSEIFRSWFGEGFLPHYARDNLPERHDLEEQSRRHRVVIYGHFNSAKGFGQVDYYPNVRQTVTILRDPLERMISNYYFRRLKADKIPQFRASAKMTLEDFLSGWPYEDPNMGPPMAAFMPQPCTLNNYTDLLEEYFVALGVTEQLDRSLDVFARAFGFERATGDLKHVNAAPRDTQPLGINLDDFRERARLDYALYDYAAAWLKQQPNTGAK
ncbi:sulfotransferase family protein [Pseudoruegeria sp. SHC-113]|uniref:sulfotransferase family protein n=1 Tax=Pseudoruegeria sp. SHC-113 TaxID=2855439 RepID=UPI0021BA9230|nr:sulfotransferase family protein [Pseudoruegeria sp. SHC-113]MCT8161683.1 sulfotransferase family protein [Pseudoruegeria sp. SHC-113]